MPSIYDIKNAVAFVCRTSFLAVEQPSPGSGKKGAERDVDEIVSPVLSPTIKEVKIKIPMQVAQILLGLLKKGNNCWRHTTRLGYK